MHNHQINRITSTQIPPWSSRRFKSPIWAEHVLYKAVTHYTLIPICLSSNIFPWKRLSICPAKTPKSFTKFGIMVCALTRVSYWQMVPDELQSEKLTRSYSIILNLWVQWPPWTNGMILKMLVSPIEPCNVDVNTDIWDSKNSSINICSSLS
jgi:hypothetical protein